MSEVNHLKICGVDVPFPHKKPYPAQMAIMANTINAMRKGQNAVLESPTGTGKTAALLASSLSFQKYLRETPSEPAAQLDPPPIRNYLGFFPPRSFQTPGTPIYNPLLTKNMPSDKIPRYCPDATPDEMENGQEYSEEFAIAKRHVKQIWYSTRTHQQLKQLVKELKQLPFHPQMCILGSRAQVCIHKRVASSMDVDGACNDLQKAGGCPYDKHSSIPKEFKPFGFHDKFELEELKDFCRRFKYCPYVVSRLMMRAADIVFCPYNYFLDPKVKGQMQLDLTGTFMIIDEAHNVENNCRDGGSFHHSRSKLNWGLMYLRKQIKALEEETPKKIAMKIVLDILIKEYKWFDMRTEQMRATNKLEYVAPSNVEVLDTWSLNPQSFELLVAAFDCIFKLGNSANTPDFIAEMEGEKVAMALMGELEQLWVMLAIVFKKGCNFMNDYKIAITLDPNDPNEDTLHGLVMNPGVIFKRPAEEAHCVLMASGTMSPLTTFAGELGQPFPIQVSAPHVIDSSQVAAFTITSGEDGTPLTSTYTHLVKNNMRDSTNRCVGEILLKLLPIIPNGVLFFAPSHYFLEQLVETWQRYNMYDRINSMKPIFQETPESDPEFFDNFKASATTPQGALLLGVFRGRSSEGIDFVDEQARAVFAFGIPFPSYRDLEVQLKRTYNEERHPGSGDEWYDTQAFRALFQAIGRCIRHRNDYGSIILIDSRFPKELERFPRWMKPCIKVGESLDQIARSLYSFYGTMQTKFPSKFIIALNAPLTLYCGDCNKLIFSIVAQSTDQTMAMSAHSEFMEYVFGEPTDEILLIKRNEMDEINLQYEENTFSPNEKIVFQRAVCSCGKCIGAKIHATTSSMISHNGGIWIVLGRVKTKVGEAFVNVYPAAATKKHQKMTLGLSSKSQSLLRFE